MANFSSICFSLLSILLLFQFALSVESPTNSPSNSPSNSPLNSPLNSPSNSPLNSPIPISSPPDSSPMAAPSESPSDLAPSSVPAPSTSPSSPSSSPSPSPHPSEASDVNRSNVSVGEESEGESRDGMNGGQKFGIAIGVIAAVALVGFGGVVYKKRRDNLRRSRYGYAARREIL